MSEDIQFGAFLVIPDSIVAEAIAHGGFDYVVVDGQHGLLGFEAMLAMLQAMAGAPATVLVRVLDNDPARIGRVLDAGADGIIIPMVNSAAEARTAVAATRYAPEGVRSYGPVRANLKHGPGYFDAYRESLQVIPQIETAAASDAIDDIVAVDGVTGVYIGPSDLHISLGHPPSMDSEAADFNAAVDRVLAACRRTGVTPAIHATNTSAAHKRRAQGFKMITVASDLGALRQGMTGLLNAAREDH